MLFLLRISLYLQALLSQLNVKLKERLRVETSVMSVFCVPIRMGKCSFLRLRTSKSSFQELGLPSLPTVETSPCLGFAVRIQRWPLLVVLRVLSFSTQQDVKIAVRLSASLDKHHSQRICQPTCQLLHQLLVPLQL